MVLKFRFGSYLDLAESLKLVELPSLALSSTSSGTILSFTSSDLDEEEAEQALKHHVAQVFPVNQSWDMQFYFYFLKKALSH